MYISKMSSNLHRKLNDTNPQTSNLNNNSTPPTSIPAPYIRGALSSERIARVLKRFDINLPHKSTLTLSNELCHL